MIDWSSLLQRNGAEIATPALVIDLDAFERNIARMADHCRQSGVSLRPHAKTHKCVEVARRQIAAGAIGQCCAILDEAEHLASAGIENILINSPLVSEISVRRLIALNARCPGLMAVVDSKEAASRLSQAAFAAGQTLTLLVDIDVGHHRTGIGPGEPAASLAAHVAQSPALIFAGIQGYAGHVQHIADRVERELRSGEAMEKLRLTREMLKARGLAPRIVSGAGTGSFDIDPARQVLTELQCGSYVFMDRQYNDVWADGPPFETSLFVLSRVVSANQPDMVTTDAGLKAFSTDADAPLIAYGPKGAIYSFFGDEYGKVRLAEGQPARAGEAVVCVTPHCDPTVNLYGHYVVIKGGEVIDHWATAGGKYR
jgi:D-serine deaminase-like pyridoxal phosphate-dependent protein